ncbi:hypothetical protein A3709_04480 [Halioglobus sp. HI00S01]|uniref:DUF2237 family protein n=1 Tax=Halioglobus sp. HI00S01 TaxID=1822214 RepID=UPI0007C38D90|nr:DUF2237 domain-containing protein [Halioglobus sp. HI00S01]KZX57033.1 hypothetical protein A3709_04480 [Halioglobus sp. HI00S01]
MTDSQPEPGTRKNVLGKPLVACCHAPRTGFYRDGFCRMDKHDRGRHVICAEMTAAFLAFTRQLGNDLSTPRPEFDFPGLQPGDRWCLCALRWREAHEAGTAPKVILEACDASALQVVSIEVLQRYAITGSH